MLLNYCCRKIFLTRFLAEKKNRKQLFIELISLHYCIMWIDRSCITEPISQGCLYLLAPNQKILLFLLHLIWILSIGNRWWRRHTPAYLQSFHHLGSTALHFRLQWVHQQGKTDKCLKEGKQKKQFFIRRSPWILRYKHKQTQILKRTHTHWHMHISISVVAFRKIRKTLSATLRIILSVPCQKVCVCVCVCAGARMRACACVCVLRLFVLMHALAVFALLTTYVLLLQACLVHSQVHSGLVYVCPDYKLERATNMKLKGWLLALSWCNAEFSFGWSKLRPASVWTKKGNVKIKWERE